MKILKKLTTLVLVFVLLFTSLLSVNNVRAEDPDNGEELSFEVIENDKKSVAGKLNTVENPNDSSKPVGNVRVSIVLEKDSTIDSGFSSEDIGLNPSAIAYRESLKEQQDIISDFVSKEVLSEQLDVVWNLTLAANIISANVPYDKIEG